MTAAGSIPFTDAACGDVIVYRDRTDYGVARVELVRERHLTCFPWREGDRRWCKRRARIERGRVLALLAPETAPALVAEQLAIVRNERDMQRGTAERRYRHRVHALLGLERPA